MSALTLVDEQTVQALAVRAAELNAATDELNDALESLEDRLGQMNIGVSASVLIAPECAIRYDKWGAAWRFVVYDAAGDTPLIGRCRETRAMVAPHITRLIDELTKEAERVLGKVQAAIEAVRV